MRIDQIIRNGRGQTHGWRVERNGTGSATLIHYATPMLTWNVENPHDESVLDWALGWGSVSDQNGLNTAFEVLGLPYRYDRDQRGGGARITELVRGPDGYYVRAEALR